MWSLGVILYALIARQLPFDNEHIPTLLDLIKRGKYDWSREIGPTARDLIARMITINVSQRIKVRGRVGIGTIGEDGADEWLNGGWVD